MLKQIIIIIIIFFLSCGDSGRLPEQKNSKIEPTQSKPKGENYCDVHSTSCNFRVYQDQKKILEGILELNPKPVKAMQPIEFELKLTENVLENPEIFLNLTMPAMYMGINKVFLKRVSNNIYKGNGMFAECVTEDRRWNIKIVFKEKEKIYTADIQFDIIQ